jgi:hypothetical protein
MYDQPGLVNIRLLYISLEDWLYGGLRGNKVNISTRQIERGTMKNDLSGRFRNEMGG